MAWITTKDGRRVNTEWFDKDKQIAQNKAEVDSRNNKTSDSISDELKKSIENSTTKAQIIKLLKGQNYIDDSKNAGYTQFKIPTKDGVIRIYKPYGRKNFIVQKMVKTTFEYSGTPTFMPGGKDTFRDRF